MGSPKYRDYFITINEGAECYEEALDIVKSNLNFKLYAFIIHNKDIITEVNESGELTEKAKKIHKHIVVELKNPVSFDSIKNKFVGAHIETIKYKKSAYQYLIHSNANAKEKYQYPVEDIISNNLEAVKEAITAEEGLRLFREAEFMRYIAEGINTPYFFSKSFGLNAYKQYWKAYSDMLEESKHNDVMKRDLEAITESMREELPF